MKAHIILLAALLLLPLSGSAQEQDRTGGFSYPDVSIMIDEPESFIPGARTEIIFYALPNGNSIEWTAGKKMEEGDDWHYDIQHIAAQTAFLRDRDRKSNIVTVYLMARQKAWNNWHRQHPDICKETYESIFADVIALYAQYSPSVTISSHSGGGYLIFNYFNVVEKVNPAIKRIVFLDSVYGYDTELHLAKFTEWLREPDHYLSVITYEDTTVIYDGKPLVTPTGGGWGRSHQMVDDFGKVVRIKARECRVKGSDSSLDTIMEVYRALGGRISIKVLRNPDGKIWHTVLVAQNGFIDSDLTGTRREGRGYDFWGKRAYEEYIR